MKSIAEMKGALEARLQLLRTAESAQAAADALAQQKWSVGTVRIRVHYTNVRLDELPIEQMEAYVSRAAIELADMLRAKAIEMALADVDAVSGLRSAP